MLLWRRNPVLNTGIQALGGGAIRQSAAGSDRPLRTESGAAMIFGKSIAVAGVSA
jgi:hypothetical protein